MEVGRALAAPREAEVGRGGGGGVCASQACAVLTSQVSFQREIVTSGH